VVSVVQLSSANHRTIQFLCFVCHVGRLCGTYRTALRYAAGIADFFGGACGRAADSLNTGGVAIGAAGSWARPVVIRYQRRGTLGWLLRLPGITRDGERLALAQKSFPGDSTHTAGAGLLGLDRNSRSARAINREYGTLDCLSVGRVVILVVSGETCF